MHRAVSPHCPFMLSLSSTAKCETVRTRPTTTAADAASVPTLKNPTSTPTTKRKALDSVTQNGTFQPHAQKKVKKMPSLTGSPMTFCPQLSSPLQTMTHALGIMPLLVQAQQYSALFQSQVALQQLMQSLFCDPTKPPQLDSTQAFPSLLPTDFSALYSGSIPFNAMQPGAGLSTCPSSFNSNSV